MAGKVQVIEKNNGTKIDFRQKGYKLYFGDDDLILRCDTRQREHPVHIDICADEDGNLVTGLDGVKGYYVAQVDIPAYSCTEPEKIGELSGEEETEQSAKQEILPLNMDDVTVTLWSIDGLYLNY